MYRGLECEHTFTGLTPGHLYRIHCAAVSEGGTSEVNELFKDTQMHYSLCHQLLCVTLENPRIHLHQCKAKTYMY